MRRLKILCFLFSILTIQESNSQPIKYPITRKSDQVDDYFSVKVADPYRWLEDDHSSETADWVKNQNDLTENYLKQIPFRDSLKAKMIRNWSFVNYAAPFRAGNSYFYYRRDVKNNQPVLYYMRTMEYVPIQYFDPNKLSEDGTTAISQTVPSNDGLHVAFVLSESGSDWNVIRIKETKSMKTLPETLTKVKFSGIAWWNDGFFYSRYDANSLSKAYTEKNEFHKVYYHKLGNSQELDSLVFEDKNHPMRNFSASITEDEKFLVITGTESTSGNNLYIQNLSKPTSKLIQVVKTFEHDFDLIGNVGDDLFFITNYNADKKKIIKINANSPQVNMWKDFIPEQKEILQGATFCWKSILVHYMKDATSKVYIYNYEGAKVYEIPFSGLGTVESINGSPSDTNVFISYASFISPSTVYRYNMKKNFLAIMFKPAVPYDLDQFETKQIFYTSKDGTKIPMFIVAKKGYTLNGKNPTLLYGYGGFNISKTPEFKPERLVFLEQGGIFAMPCLRGGGEYGTEWHQAGTKLKKQNVFDDFIAAAEYLIKEGYTNHEKLAISGRSNGGLLVGAVMTQRPDLFKVALPAVGVMDMLRFHKFTIGWAWKSDYGSSEDSIQFKAIYAYSPLHNIKSGVNYPATMVTTADHDDRVVPSHSFKFIATLQEHQQGQNPVLIRIDTNAGHGSGKPTGKLIDEQADIFSFLFYNLGMTL